MIAIEGGLLLWHGEQKLVRADGADVTAQLIHVRCADDLI